MSTRADARFVGRYSKGSLLALGVREMRWAETQRTTSTTMRQDSLHDHRCICGGLHLFG